MKHFYLTLCLLILSLCAWAGTNPATRDTTPEATAATTPAGSRPMPRVQTLAPEGWEIRAAEEMAALVASQPLHLQQRQFEALSMAAPLAADVLVEGPLHSPGTPLDTVQYYIAKARGVIDKIRQTGNFIKYLDASSEVELPVGISKTVGGLEYTIGIDSIRLLPTHAEFDAYMEFVMPQNGKTLTFMGKGIKFSKSGGIVGDARLELLQDYAINENGNKIQLVLKGTMGAGQGTFVRFDCDGFQEMGLDAEVVFSRDLLIPEGPTGDPMAAGRVSSRFTTSLTDWNDLVVELSLPPFQVAKLKGVGFTANKAVFDFSDLRNVPGVVYPANYEGLTAYGETPELWRGFYMRELSIRLPKQFKDKSQPSRTEFAAYNMLIDRMGFTGTVVAKDLITRENGRMGGWEFSVDSLKIELLANQLQYGRLKGEILLPPAPESPLAYGAIIQPDSGSYVFTVSPQDEMKFNLWGAGKLNLKETSYLEVAVISDEFRPKAVLDGTLSLTASLGEGSSTSATLADIRFEQLQLSSSGQRVRIGAMSLSSTQNKMAKFPIQIKEIGAVSQGNELGLQVGIKLNLMEAASEGFAADGRFIVWGSVDTLAASENWKYERIEVSELGIDVVKENVYELHGRVNFYSGEATYGNGFKGTLQAKLGGVDVQAMALFGNVEGLRYWYADALASMGTGIVLAPGLNIYGFGGGVYHHMRQEGYNDQVSSTLGETSSGITYLPTDAVHMGFKATVAFGAQKKEAWNGDATFEISLNRHGGINQVGFLGNVYVMSTNFGLSPEQMKKASEALAASGGEAPEPDSERADIIGQINLLFDQSNKVFHGDMHVYVDAAGGLIKGVGANNRAGWAVLHFAPGSWYVHIGSPTDPIGLKMIGLFETRSYFMVGDEIPGSPPPPANVVNILGGGDYDYMRDLNSLGNGQGFAFGSHLSVSTGEKTFLIFYGQFDAGAGFDIMVKDYGDVQCVGRSGPIGINGWYANGQAYAYFQGAIGIKVNLKFKKGKFKILDIGAAALLQAKGPNPFWMQGTVGGQYMILGGLVKGNCKFEVTIGDECELINGNALDGVEVIAEITPMDGASDVNVFNAPQAIFNLAVEQTFELEDPATQQVRAYRVKLDYFKIKDGSYVIPGTFEWNDDHTVLAFNSYDILPGEKDLVAEVQVRFEEKVNGSWQDFKVDGQVFTESLKTKFRTGVAPDHIPMNNIAYAYPLPQQYNLYRNETGAGYVKLIRGQDYLFEADKEFEHVIRFRTDGGQLSQILPASYSTSENQVNFTMPNNLTAETYYAFDIYSRPRTAQAAVDANIKQKEKKVDLGAPASDENETVVTTREAEGAIDLLQDKILLTYRVRTSRHTTFAEKVAQLEKNKGWLRPLSNGIDELGQTYWGEPFDQYEMEGTPWDGEPLVSFEAQLSGTHWDRRFLAKDLYLNYPMASWATIAHSDVEVYGVPPLKAVYLRQDEMNILTPENSSELSLPRVQGAFIYDLPRAVASDFAYLRSRLASHVANGGSLTDDMEHVLEARWLPILDGDYPIKVIYRLPGTLKKTSEATTTPYNPIGIQ